jgi:hypothetical protein
VSDRNGRGSGSRELNRCRKKGSKFHLAVLHHNCRIQIPHAETVETVCNHYLMGSTGEKKHQKITGTCRAKWDCNNISNGPRFPSYCSGWSSQVQECNAFTRRGVSAVLVHRVRRVACPGLTTGANAASAWVPLAQVLG